ncbi:hypothetical protein [uncultured Brachyspira sp.]|uniref:hypothetical protein n=1 Tax=uncultured Brachyspira sp. TaxID=221953 RepID=UPI0027DC5AC2|nr:hypothetical protein [uncultured Brachyspira sp.]
MVLYAYTIDKKLKTLISENKLVSDLISKLENTIIRNRMREINKDSEEMEFIIFYENFNDYIFGLMINMGIGVTEEISQNTLNKKQAKLEDLNKDAKKDVAGFKKDMYYFCLKNDKLVLTGRNNMKSFELYINWLLDLNEDRYIVIPLNSKLENNITFNDIRSIELDKVLSNETELEDGKEENRKFQRIFDATKNLKEEIIKIIAKSNNLTDSEIKNIIDAKIIFTIKNRKNKDMEEIRKTLKIIDIDYFKIRDNKGREISAESIIEKKEIKVRKTKDNNYIDTNDLKSQMVEYLESI